MTTRRALQTLMFAQQAVFTRGQYKVSPRTENRAESFAPSFVHPFQMRQELGEESSDSERSRSCHVRQPSQTQLAAMPSQARTLRPAAICKEIGQSSLQGATGLKTPWTSHPQHTPARLPAGNLGRQSGSCPIACVFSRKEERDPVAPGRPAGGDPPQSSRGRLKSFRNQAHQQRLQIKAASRHL